MKKDHKSGDQAKQQKQQLLKDMEEDDINKIGLNSWYMPFHQMMKHWIIWKTYGIQNRLPEEVTFINLKNKIETLGKMLNKFLQTVEQEHQSPK